jgi:hypothetical protein
MTPMPSKPPSPSGRPCLDDGAPDAGTAALRTLVSVATRRDAGSGTTHQPRRSYLLVSAQAPALALSIRPY